MIPRDHGFGKSFKGIGQYLLHDPDHANTNERVAWTHTHNLFTDDADLGFRIMAATAMDQRRIKEQAWRAKQEELPPEARSERFIDRGKKSALSVWHFSLSWEHEESKSITRDEMIRAAESSLTKLGADRTKYGGEKQFADQHQAIFVCHEDKDHRHVHVVVNRVHPEHGKMISKYNDWHRFSRWAEKYERDRGQILCEQRVENNKARDRNQAEDLRIKTYYDGDMPHHIAKATESAREASNDNRSDLQALQATQRAENARLAKLGAYLVERRQRQEAQNVERYAAAKQAADEEARRAAPPLRSQVQQDYMARERELQELQAQQRDRLAEREAAISGKAKNIIDAIKGTWKLSQENERQYGLNDYFDLLDAGKRQRRLEEVLQAEQVKLDRDRQRETAEAVKPVWEAQRQAKEMAREDYTAQAQADQERYDQLAAQLQQRWQQRHQDQAIAYNRLALQKAEELRVREQFARAAEVPRQQREEDSKAPLPPAPPEPTQTPEEIARQRMLDDYRAQASPLPERETPQEVDTPEEAIRKRMMEEFKSRSLPDPDRGRE